MSATDIPNLNSLRRGGLRGRGKGATTSNARKTQDDIVQGTDNDAATSRLSAVDAGYLNDPFARLLTSNEVQRRLPLMNRGTYVRTMGIDRIVHTFLGSSPGRKQIVSLGAGSDTRFFRLKKGQPQLDILYHEIDFAANTNIKIEHLKIATSEIKSLCGVNLEHATISDGTLHSENYHIHAQDLRIPSDVLGIDDTLPTLVISECCLIYMSPSDAEAVLSRFNILQTCAVAIYEPIRPDDAFGRTMIRNLTTRGIQLQTLERYASLTLQRQRLADHNFQARAADIKTIWRNWIDEPEKERVDGLEWLDEIEEFNLLAEHYCISWGWRGFVNDTQWHVLLES